MYEFVPAICRELFHEFFRDIQRERVLRLKGDADGCGKRCGESFHGQEVLSDVSPAYSDMGGTKPGFCNRADIFSCKRSEVVKRQSGRNVDVKGHPRQIRKLLRNVELSFGKGAYSRGYDAEFSVRICVAQCELDLQTRVAHQRINGAGAVIINHICAVGIQCTDVGHVVRAVDLGEIKALCAVVAQAVRFYRIGIILTDIGFKRVGSAKRRQWTAEKIKMPGAADRDKENGGNGGECLWALRHVRCCNR